MENISCILSMLLFIVSVSSFAYAGYLAKDFLDLNVASVHMRFSMTADASSMLSILHKFFNDNKHAYRLKKAKICGIYGDEIDIIYKAYCTHDKNIDFAMLAKGHLHGKMRYFKV